MLLFKIVQQFILPSVFLLLFIGGGLILSLLFPKRKIGKIMLMSGVFVFYLLSITPVVDIILTPLEGSLIPAFPGSAHTIVMLLGGGEHNILRASEVVRLSYAHLQASQRPFLIILSGTDPFHPKSSMASEMKTYLMERGIPEKFIQLEDSSRTTRESARNLRGVLGEKPFFLVTSAYHMKRSVEEFRRNGMNPIPAPTDFKRKHTYHILDFFPNAENVRNADLAFHEYIGILFYRLF